MSRTYHLLVPNVIPIFCAIGLMVCPADAGKVGEWRSYGSDNSSTKFLPLDQINKGNVKDLPPLGWGQRNFPLLTQTLLFTAAQAQWDVTGNSPRGNAIEVTFDDQNPFLWAFDPDNGQLISRTKLPSNAQGAPMTYMADGKQYIVIPIGGANRPAELIALSLP